MPNVLPRSPGFLPAPPRARLTAFTSDDSLAAPVLPLGGAFLFRDGDADFYRQTCRCPAMPNGRCCLHGQARRGAKATACGGTVTRVKQHMQSLRAFLIIPILLGASACAPYDPPAQGDHTAEQYKADLEKCRTTSTESVRLKNAATIQSWVISPFTGPPAVRAAIRTCMAGKGYTLEKTDD